MQKVAVFPGSFDPVTRGHESLVIRALSLFDKIYVAVGQNSGKNHFFACEKRVNWLKEVFRGYPSVEVEQYSGLTIDFCRKVGATYILRGLRTSSDFEFERSIGQVNKMIEPGIETIFFLSMPEHTPVNSSIVRDIIRNGGDPSPFIPAGISIREGIE
ncbi:MAG: pantetheine-phosphate adenylyltransferase [Bacteroidetes bacterium]|nr:pantetheine-phosphate adenylyltransferase [Bacteroidota bacterium]